jgi:hypothetical protein
MMRSEYHGNCAIVCNDGRAFTWGIKNRVYPMTQVPIENIKKVALSEVCFLFVTGKLSSIFTHFL